MANLGRTGTEISVTNGRTGDQNGPAALVLRDGRLVIAYADPGAEESGPDLRLRLFSDQGVASGADRLATEDVENGQSDVAAIAFGSGGVLAYVESVETGSRIGVQRLDAGGQLSGSPVFVGISAAQAEDPSLIALSGGGFAVTWVETGGIRLQRLTSGGALSGDVVNIAAAGDGAVTQPRLTQLASGALVAVWTRLDGGEDDAGTSVRARVIGTDGSLGSVFVIEPARALGKGDPAVVALTGGGFMIAWTEDAGETGGSSLRAQIFNASGVAQGGAFFVGGAESDGQGPALLALPGNRVLVAWDNGSDVFAQTLTAGSAGATLDGSPLRVNETAGTALGEVTLARTGDGRILVGWTADGSDAGDEIRARFLADGTAPSLTVTPVTAAENSRAGTVLARISASDADAGDSVRLSLSGADAALFEIVGTEIRSRGAGLNFESQNRFAVTVTATDEAGLTTSRPATLNISDVNEAPVLSASAPAVAENSPAGTVIARLTAADPDAGDSVRLVLGGRDADLLSLSGSTVTLRSNVVLDHETRESLSFTVSAIDEGALSTVLTLNPLITDLPEAPVLTAAPEDLEALTPAGTAVAVLTAVDADAGDSVTLTLSGPDAAKFTIVGTELRAAVDLDRTVQPAYDVTVTATDETERSDSVDLRLGDGAGNDAPVLRATRLTIPENSPGGTVAARFEASDPEGDALTFTLTGASADRFRIVGDEIRVRPDAVLNFEAGPLPALFVRATDANGASSSILVTPVLSNVNEQPRLVVTPPVAPLPDTLRPGASVAVLTPGDPDRGDAVTVTLTGRDAGLFVVRDGAVRVRDDLEDVGGRVLQVTVNVTDRAGLVTSRPLQLRVADSNDPPVIQPRRLTVDWLDGAGKVADLSASDPDGDALRFALTGGSLARFFRIDAETGVLTLRDPLGLGQRGGQRGTVQVQVTDPDGESDRALMTVQILPPRLRLGATERADEINGLAVDELIAGRGGNDTLFGRGGDDLLRGGAGNDRLRGGPGEDRVEGNAGNDSLYGGPGADVLIGGSGNDGYLQQDLLDRIIENPGGGTDILITETERTVLPANVENLRAAAGTTPTVLTGNALNNVIRGNAGDSRIDGLGGRDVLFGRGGDDSFVLSTPPAGQPDRILDFGRGDDSLLLSGAVFAGLGGPGALDPAAFARGTMAMTEEQRILFDGRSGLLRHDPDGTGPEAATVIAVLKANAPLTAADILVI